MTPSDGNAPKAGTSHLPVPYEAAASTAVIATDSGWTRAEQTPVAPSFTSPLSVGGLSKALAHRWLLALTVSLGCFVTCAGVAWYFVPAKYTAYALLRIAEAEVELLPDARRAQMAQGERYFENTQPALIKSRPILNAALLQPGVSTLETIREEADPRVWLEENLSVGFLPGTLILRVALSGTRPADLEKLVNAVKDAYMVEAVDAQRRQKNNRLEKLETAYAVAAANVRQQRVVLGELTDRLKTSDSKTLSAKQQALVERYFALKKMQLALKQQLATAEITLVVQSGMRSKAAVAVAAAAGASAAISIRSKDGPPVPEAEVDQELDRDLLLQQQKFELAQKNNNLVATRARASRPTKLASLTVLADQHKALLAEYEAARASRRAAVREILRGKKELELENKMQETRNNIEVLKRNIDKLEPEVASAGNEADRVGLGSADLEGRRKDVEQDEIIVNHLRQEKQRLEIEVKSTNDRVTLLYPAEVPDRKNLPAQLRVVGFVGFTGLLLGLFGVGYFEAHNQRILSKDEVVQELGMRVVGALPWIEAAPVRGRRGRRSEELAALLGESVDAIRTMLLCETEDQPTGRILMVTSAVAQEGKTTLTSHLAVSIARAGRRTLLLDCDFRRPEIHRVFDAPRGPGLSEVLRGEVTLVEALRAGPVAGLSILTAGEDSRELNPSLVMDDLRKLLDGLRSQYDLVLIDCSPVLPVADALLLGRRVDGVLLSVRPRLSQLPQVYAAYERLHALRIPVLGAVLNGVRARLSSYEYRYLLESKVHA